MHPNAAFLSFLNRCSFKCVFWGPNAISRALYELWRMVKIVGYSHLWIALGALCSALATMHAYAPVDPQDESTWGIATAIGLGTGVLYTLQRRIKWSRMPQNMPVDRRQFIGKWFEWVISSWIIGVLIWLVTFWNSLIPWLNALTAGWPLVLALLALALGYASNPFLNQGNGWRDVSRMKLPVIAITWGLATVWVPGVMSGEGPWEVNLIVRAIAQSTFIAGLTIPFDVRDLQIDPAAMNTVPQRVGQRRAAVIALLLILLSGCFFMAAGNALAPMVAAACAIPGVIYGRSTRDEWLYSIILDGCLIVQGFVIFFY